MGRVWAIAAAMGLGALTAPTAIAAPTCVANASNISFGSLGVSALAGATSTGTIYEGCSGGWATGGNLSVCNAIGAGSNSVSQTNRTMTNGSYSISYNLYSDAAMTAPYAYPGSDIFYVPYSTASGGYTTTTTYAKILSSSTGIAPGTYTDTFTTASQTDVNFRTSLATRPRIGCGASPLYVGVTAPFTVSVIVLASCSVSASNLSFGAQGVLAANVDATTTVSVTCTNTTGYTVALGPGNGSGATTTNRSMTGGGKSVKYALYRDAARTLNWGNVPPPSPSADTVSGVGNGTAQSLTVYGRVPPQTTPPQGVYSDSVLVTVTY